MIYDFSQDSVSQPTTFHVERILLAGQLYIRINSIYLMFRDLSLRKTTIQTTNVTERRESKRAMILTIKKIFTFIQPRLKFTPQSKYQKGCNGLQLLRYIWKPNSEDGVWCSIRKQIGVLLWPIPLVNCILGTRHLLILPPPLIYFVDQCNRKFDCSTSVLLAYSISKRILSMSLMRNNPPSRKTKCGYQVFLIITSDSSTFSVSPFQFLRGSFMSFRTNSIRIWISDTWDSCVDPKCTVFVHQTTADQPYPNLNGASNNRSEAFSRFYREKNDFLRGKQKSTPENLHIHAGTTAFVREKVKIHDVEIWLVVLLAVLMTSVDLNGPNSDSENCW